MPTYTDVMAYFPEPEPASNACIGFHASMLSTLLGVKDLEQHPN